MASNPQPVSNVLLLFSDEQRADTLGAYGNTVAHTQCLDALAERSLIFEQAFCTQPVCTPSRGSILTGLYPHTHGALANNLPLPAHAAALPQLLAGGRAGGGAPPRTAYIGKWHLGRELEAQHGFQEWSSTEDSYTHDPAGGYSDYHRFLLAQGLTPDAGPERRRVFSRGFAARLPEALGKPAFTAERAIRFLEDCRREGRAFILCVNFLEPHMPFFGPRDGLIPRGEVTLPPTFFSEPEPGTPLRYRLLRQRYAQRNAHVATDDAPGWTDLLARYWGLCSLVDSHCGRILDALADLGLEESTLVAYTSDHGDMMGEHRLVAKCVQYEGAIRVPLLLRRPGVRPGRAAAPVSLVDLVPTLLEGLGHPVPAQLPGRSLLAGAGAPGTGAAAADPEVGPAAVVEWNGADELWPPELFPGPAAAEARYRAARLRTLRTGRWKLTLDETGEHTLYDLAEDPGETRNLIAHPSQRTRVRQLAARLRQWQRRTEDTVAFDTP